MKKIAKVLITQDPIPSDGYISWPQMMEYLLMQYAGNEIDYLLCGPSSKPFESKYTRRIICTTPGRIQNKLLPKKRFSNFTKNLKEIASNYDFVIVSIWDSVKLQVNIYEELEKEALTRKIKFLFYNHGFSYFHSLSEHSRFSRTVTEMVMLSKNAYLFDFQRYPSIPFPVQIIQNPINHQRFHALSPKERAILRQQKAFDDKIHFLWVGHDKPVKGLDIVLAAWGQFQNDLDNLVLHIVGAQREMEIPGVVFHGKILNSDLPEWYQASDIVIFSPLRNEGYGLVLSEAISCGCLAIATWGGGMVEFFKEDQHGIAIREPNFLSAWVAGFKSALARLPEHTRQHIDDYLLPPLFDTYDEWSNKYLSVFNTMGKRYI